jgi:hypothetical protein
MSESPAPAAEFVSPKFLAYRYSVPPRTVHNRIKAGVFTAIKIGHEPVPAVANQLK